MEKANFRISECNIFLSVQATSVGSIYALENVVFLCLIKVQR